MGRIFLVTEAQATGFLGRRAQVEGVEHRLADGAVAVKRVEDGDPVRAADNRLAIERERRRAELHRRRNDPRIAGRPVEAAPCEEPHAVAFAADLQAVTIMLDLVSPVGPGRRLGGASWDAGRNITGVSTPGLPPPPNMAGAAFRVSLPFVHVVKFNGRCYLLNGAAMRLDCAGPA